jgi:hypothetical protein
MMVVTIRIMTVMISRTVITMIIMMGMTIATDNDGDEDKMMIVMEMTITTIMILMW